jgi:signal transduction histidine kinase
VQIAAILTFAFLAIHATIPGFDSAVATASRSPLGPVHYYLHATVLSLATLGVGQISHVLSAGFAATFRRATVAQHELLISHAERVRELTTLSAEIAHELKNPLASIKGLGALLTQNVSDDRGSERLRVLRREIDRMQGVLDEFLNFSRPLVPLSLRQCDVREVAVEVLALHEGLARQRGVRLGLDGPRIEARCDPRKIKQILINLVQNALEASPAGSELRVETSEQTEAIRLSVSDDGEGLDGELGDVFEPGITSKSGGAGIGLTIARALARQHQGELTLRSRDRQGTIAVLSLPKEPAASQTQEVA